MPARRMSKWKAKYRPQRLAEDITIMLPDMTPHIEAVFGNIVLMEAQVRQVLNGEGVSVIDYPFYLDFGREVWAKIEKGITGDSLSKEIAVLMQKWTARGLAQPVLELIRNQVFSVSPPGL